MNKLTTVAIYVVLAACSATAAQARQAAATEAQVQRWTDPAVHCADISSGVGATQPCGTRAGETLRLGADTTRQEFECVMSGVCSVTDRGRVAS